MFTLFCIPNTCKASRTVYPYFSMSVCKHSLQWNITVTNQIVFWITPSRNETPVFFEKYGNILLLVMQKCYFGTVFLIKTFSMLSTAAERTWITVYTQQTSHSHIYGNSCVQWVMPHWTPAVNWHIVGMRSIAVNSDYQQTIPKQTLEILRETNLMKIVTRNRLISSNTFTWNISF